MQRGQAWFLPAWRWATICLVCLHTSIGVTAHESKDFDDSILYRIEFDIPDFNANPELKNHLRTFYTHEKEKYDCVIPVVDDAKEEQKSNEPELSPITLLQPIFYAPSCSYRIEAYWSYEICHGLHVRQSHEEREGKNVKLQEYYLGKWSEENTEQLIKTWESERLAGIKYKTTKIENTKYPYFEMVMTDGTMCDIINAPRTTYVRYVCYQHGKNEIYSFKEISSCNYEAIILTSALCIIPAFHPEESKEVSIKCFNSPTEPHKPLSMLRQELSEMQLSEDDFPVSKDGNTAAMALARSAAAAERYSFFNKLGSDVDKLLLELMMGAGVDVDTTQQSFSGEMVTKPPTPPITDLSPIKEFISGKNCLTGGTGWWKYEFCYGRHVRQFHKDKKSETELILGYFSETAHRHWVAMNPDKMTKRGFSAALWHHYEKGTRCDRTGQPREVDVKLTCSPITNSATTVSMYLLEPKTCQYILVVESPIVCDLMQLADEYGLVRDEKLQQLLQRDTLLVEADLREEKSTAGKTSESEKIVQDNSKSPVENAKLSESVPPQDVRA